MFSRFGFNPISLKSGIIKTLKKLHLINMSSGREVHQRGKSVATGQEP
jgi:hypothetical protein